MTKYLDLAYLSDDEKAAATTHSLDSFVNEKFPESVRTTLQLLPTERLPKEPFYELLEGFRMDLSFTQPDSPPSGGGATHFPIEDEKALELYAHRVASTVGELCLWLVFHHCRTRSLPEDTKTKLIGAARTMGHALQYVNIARDIRVDAAIDRVYLPTSWLRQEDGGLTPADIIRDPGRPAAERLRQRLLDLAFAEYARARPIMGALPDDVRAPLIVAVESYMEIGRVEEPLLGLRRNIRYD